MFGTLIFLLFILCKMHRQADEIVSKQSRSILSETGFCFEHVECLILGEVLDFLYGLNFYLQLRGHSLVVRMGQKEL